MNYYNPYLQPNPYTPVYDPRTQPAQQKTTPVQQTQYNPNMQRPNMIYGRSVNSAEEITPQEVPMDGSVSLFPKTDYSCIYAKMWNTDGTIRTVTFVPELPQDGQAQVNPVMQAFDNINERLDKIEKSLNKRNRPYKKHQNKEVDNNEQPNFQPAQQINQQ